MGVYEFFSDEIEAVKEMSKPMRRRFFLFTFGGLLLSALGLGIIVFFCVSGFFIVIGTVVLILGISIIELGSPGHYNGRGLLMFPYLTTIAELLFMSCTIV